LFSGLDNLDQLILNYNHISHLGPGMFSGMPKLTTLYIDHNQVRTIHPEAFDDLQGEFGNLSCQCHDQQFL
jgi:Leucine-rich repeat (LRR) protein